MNKLVSLLPFAAVALVSLLNMPSVHADYLGLNPEGLPIFTIDLDLPPRERFKEPSKFFAKGYMKI